MTRFEKFTFKNIEKWNAMTIDCFAHYKSSKCSRFHSKYLHLSIKVEVLEASTNSFSLEASANNLFKWFRENHRKTNGDKCHLLVNTKSAVSANIGEFVINNSYEEKLFGINSHDY